MIKLITHNDLDGVACYIVAKYFLDEEIDVSYCSYDNVNDVTIDVIEKHQEYNKIFITDISVSTDVAEKLDSIKNKVQLLDHHRSALYLNEYTWARVVETYENRKTCGTQMLFDFLVEDYANGTMTTFVELVRRYDTWEWYEMKDMLSKQINDLLYIIGKDEFVESMIEKTKLNMKLLNSVDEKILHLRQNEIDRYIVKKNKQIIEKEIQGYKAGVVFAENFISELGNELCNMNENLDFVAIVKYGSVSFRTNKDDVNLDEVAKKFGGGGHPKSSGSRIDIDITKSYIDEIFKMK